jgi:hypothetical protein
MAIINAMDDDAANAIGVTKKSYLLLDNGFTPYGNIYFRIAKLLNSLDPTATFQNDAGKGDKETSIHFALMLTSLVFLFFITYLISAVITNKLEFRILVMLILNSILFIDYNWVYLIFKAHPDIMLAFMGAFAFHLSVKYKYTNDVNYYWLSGIFWGFTVGTKAVSVFFLPGLILLFIPKLKENIKKAFHYFLLIFISYLAIGFYQNFKFFNMFNFMIKQQRLSVPATQESVNEWIHLIWSQAGLAILAILILKTITYKDTSENLFRTALKLSPVFLAEIVYLFSKKITSPHEYYTLPLAAILMLFSAYAFTPVAKFVHTKLLSRYSIKEHLRIGILYGLFVFILVFVPNSFQNVIKYEFRYREESRSIYQTVITYQNNNNQICIDPYVPFDDSYQNTHKIWGINYEELKKFNPNILVLNQGFYNRFLDSIPTDYVREDYPKWRLIQNFYKSINRKVMFTDLDGHQWKKKYDHKWEIWEVEKN